MLILSVLSFILWSDFKMMNLAKSREGKRVQQGWKVRVALLTIASLFCKLVWILTGRKWRGSQSCGMYWTNGLFNWWKMKLLISSSKCSPTSWAISTKWTPLFACTDNNRPAWCVLVCCCWLASRATWLNLVPVKLETHWKKQGLSMSQTLNLLVWSSKPPQNLLTNCLPSLIAYILSVFHELGHLFMLSVETIIYKNLAFWGGQFRVTHSSVRNRILLLVIRWIQELCW